MHFVHLRLAEWPLPWRRPSTVPRIVAIPANWVQPSICTWVGMTSTKQLKDPFSSINIWPMRLLLLADWRKQEWTRMDWYTSNWSAIGAVDGMLHT